EKLTPSQIRKSITPDALISFIDGKPYTTLKRHLSKLGMTIDQDPEHVALPRDYPSTAASYSAHRSALAKRPGLGSQRKKAAATDAEPVATVSYKLRQAGRPRAPAGTPEA
ncbi:MucR family transcriptional regulator, partial [Methylobacterium sp. J-026]|uniref:MucR family transcriptional regulator n=1 Tax=Methylobacterium sp. J-026 TaxID=2836624 RepID=UPI001FB8871C